MTPPRVQWFPALIAFAGVLIGAAISAGATWISAQRQLEYARETRSYQQRVEIYSRFDALSLNLMNDFLQTGAADKARALEFNEVTSQVDLIASNSVRAAAADVHLVIAKMKVAERDELKSMIDRQLLSTARRAFKKAARSELELVAVSTAD